MKKFRQFRDPELVVDGSIVGFYPREFYVLSNFASFQVDWRGRRWMTSEHAYQAAHFLRQLRNWLSKFLKHVPHMKLIRLPKPMRIKHQATGTI